MNEDSFTSLMASVNSAMVVVTTIAEDERAGCLVGFHAQSSITPGHYCLWLSKANHTYRVGLRATHLAVHFLREGDLALAERFGTLSGENTDKFAGVDLDTDETRVPLISACPNRILLERISILDDGSDHVCVTARVVSAQSEGSFTPLRLSDVAHLDAGRASEERAIQP